MKSTISLSLPMTCCHSSYSCVSHAFHHIKVANVAKDESIDAHDLKTFLSWPWWHINRKDKLVTKIAIRRSVCCMPLVAIQTRLPFSIVPGGRHGECVKYQLFSNSRVVVGRIDGCWHRVSSPSGTDHGNHPWSIIKGHATLGWRHYVTCSAIQR